MKKVYLLMLLVALLCMLCLAACGSQNRTTDTQYDNPAEYSGVYYSGTADGRALFLYEDGRYEWYSVPVGGSPQPTGSGTFKPREGRINFGYLDGDGNFIIDNQLLLDTDRVIEGSIDFNKQADKIDTSLLDEFTAMPIPMEAYLGEWENDSQISWLTISETEYQITDSASMSAGSIVKGPDYLLVELEDNGKRLTVAADTGLKLEGTDGTYYPKGDDRLKNAPHKAFVGYWQNENTNDAIQFGENGMYSVITVGMNDDGSSNFAVSSGVYEVRDGILIFTQDDIEHTAEISDGVLRISGIDGLFDKS